MNTRTLIRSALIGLTAMVATAIPMLAPLTAAAGSTPSDPSTPPRREVCAAVDEKLLNAPYVFRYGLTGTQLQDDFYGDGNVANDGSYNDAGYMPVRLTGYVDNGQIRFATKWADVAGPEWSSRFGMTSNQFHARFLELKGKGYRILDASGYNTPGGVRYADIWLKNTSGIGWAVTRDVPAAGMDALKADMVDKGMAPTHVEGYTLPGQGTSFIVTWVESDCRWVMNEQLSSDQYQAFFDANKATKRPVAVDSYMDGSLVRFTAIMWDQDGPAFRASHGLHWYLFQAISNRNRCDGYVPDNFYVMEAPGGWNYFGGVWSYRGPLNVDEDSSLSSRVGYHVDCAGGRAGAALINVTTGESVMVHADQAYGSASAIKITILYALLRKADAEDIDLDTETIGAKTLTTLATEMIVNSNNASTNTLITYVGFDPINDEIDALGLEVTTVARYLTGGTSAYGLGTWFDDFKAGYDNFTTPRELATFYQIVFTNDGLLSADAYNRFLAITVAAPTTANNELPGGYDPAFVTYYNKAGGKTYNGSVGDFAHRPQLGTHRVASEGGVMQFSSGDLVFYAVIMDEGDPVAMGNAIACVGWEAAKEWGSGDAGDGNGNCAYP